jgi:hypothetical protein
MMTVATIPAIARALGEEIGWRGFLVPELAKVSSFAAVGLISGSLWALWHAPMILFSHYNEGTPAWYALGETDFSAEALLGQLYTTTSYHVGVQRLDRYGNHITFTVDGLDDPGTAGVVPQHRA